MVVCVVQRTRGHDAAVRGTDISMALCHRDFSLPHPAAFRGPFAIARLAEQASSHDGGRADGPCDSWPQLAETSVAMRPHVWRLIPLNPARCYPGRRRRTRADAVSTAWLHDLSLGRWLRAGKCGDGPRKDGTEFILSLNCDGTFFNLRPTLQCPVMRPNLGGGTGTRCRVRARCPDLSADSGIVSCRPPAIS